MVSLGIMESIIKSFWIGILGTFLGATLGFFELMVVGTIIRLSTGIRILPKDIEE